MVAGTRSLNRKAPRRLGPQLRPGSCIDHGDDVPGARQLTQSGQAALRRHLEQHERPRPLACEHACLGNGVGDRDAADRGARLPAPAARLRGLRARLCGRPVENEDDQSGAPRELFDAPNGCEPHPAGVDDERVQLVRAERPKRGGAQLPGSGPVDVERPDVGGQDGRGGGMRSFASRRCEWDDGEDDCGEGQGCAASPSCGCGAQHGVPSIGSSVWPASSLVRGSPRCSGSDGRGADLHSGGRPRVA